MLTPYIKKGIRNCLRTVSGYLAHTSLVVEKGDLTQG